jgi:lysophospholipase L1-like esterase
VSAPPNGVARGTTLALALAAAIGFVASRRASVSNARVDDRSIEPRASAVALESPASSIAPSLEGSSFEPGVVPSAVASSAAKARQSLRLDSLGTPITVGFVGDSHTHAGIWPRAFVDALSKQAPLGSVRLGPILAADGARFATWLARSTRELEEPLVRAETTLLVVALGTNDATDESSPGVLATAQSHALVERLRIALPKAACVLVGPTPRYDRDTAIRAIRDALAAESARLGCGFFDALAWTQSLGGRRAMRDRGLFRRDGLHLTRDGYLEMGRAAAYGLLDAPPKEPPAPH